MESFELGEICHIVGGGTPAKDRSDFYGGEIPWATVRDMRSELISDTEFKITRLAIESSATNIVPSGNVVIATRVGLGKVCLLQQDTAINQDLRAIIPRNAKQLSVRFLFWWLRSVSELIVAEGTGATVQGVKLPFIKSLVVPLPSLSEQERIVAFLDDAFAGLATAAANAEKNLKNARQLFDSCLRSALAAGNGWENKRLTEIAREFGRGKSRHRPRNYPKLYGGPYPFVQTGDISNADHWLDEYTQTYSTLGLAQSRLWPKGTVCIAIVGATVGETAILGFDACFPDSVIGIVVDESIVDGEYLEYLLQAFKAHLKEKGKGTARDNINLGTFESEQFPFPTLEVQRLITERLNEISARRRKIEQAQIKKLAAISTLKKSILQRAFSGKLTSTSNVVVALPNCDTKTAGFGANLLIHAYARHKRAERDKTYGHVKAQKILHLVEAAANIDMGRDPIKDAAGPNDFDHMRRAEDWAEQQQFFKFSRSDGRYTFERLPNYRKGLEGAERSLQPYAREIDEIIDFVLPMDTEEAEVVATVYAAWNNLIIQMRPTDDQAIVRAAREEWHADKMRIPRQKFFDAVSVLKRKNIVPTGRAKLVREKYLL